MGASIRSGRRQCRPCTRSMDGRRQGGDVVGAVVTSAVDEEGGGAGDAAQIRAIDVLRDTPGAGVLTQGGREAVEVEAELLGVADEVVEAKSVLMVEQEVVHLPERALVGGRLRGLGGELGMRVDVGERQVPPDVHAVAELAEELTDDPPRLAAVGAL